jgi:Septum formation
MFNTHHRRNSHHRRTSLAAAAILCTLSLALGGCSLIGSGDAKRDPSGVPTESSKADAFKVKVGDCMEEPDGSEVKDVTIIPCAQAHDFEAFAATKLDGSDYPGDAVVSQKAEDFCGKEFATFIGKPFNDSGLEMTYFFPTRESWKTGDKEIVCLVGGTAGEQSKGSLKGSKK